jgi:hypothetical protein
MGGDKFILIKFLLFVKMATPGRPQFFCTRPDGTLTPLVARPQLVIPWVSPALRVRETARMVTLVGSSSTATSGVKVPSGRVQKN